MLPTELDPGWSLGRAGVDGGTSSGRGREGVRYRLPGSSRVTTCSVQWTGSSPVPFPSSFCGVSYTGPSPFRDPGDLTEIVGLSGCVDYEERKVDLTVRVGLSGCVDFEERGVTRKMIRTGLKKKRKLKVDGVFPTCV